MRSVFNEIETDFIDFIAARRQRPQTEIGEIFLETKKEFELGSTDFAELNTKLYRLLRIFYDQSDERELVDSYSFYAPMHLLRFIGYSYPPIGKGMKEKGIRSLARLAGREDKGKDFSQQARELVSQLGKKPVVVDYGCGPAYLSFEIAKLTSGRTYLVDIDCLTLEFAEYRFRKHGLKAEKIAVTKKNIYPKLPKHNLCLAMEVMEHLVEPLTAYKNIRQGLETRGILYGNFEDHGERMFHVSTDLSRLREVVRKDFELIGMGVYRRC